MKKGAFVELMAAFGSSVPNVILFQYNPETLRHTWSQSAAPANPTGQSTANPLAVPGDPTETFSFSLSMEVTDQLADPDPQIRSDATKNGIYKQLAALEMLMFPAKVQGASSTGGGTGSGSGSGSGGASGSGSSSGSGGESRPTPASVLSPVLFVWGTGRIVPVRVTSLSITEKQYDEDLNPTHADAQIELRVLTSTELQWLSGLTGELATSAAQYTQGLRMGLAAAQLGDAARAAIGMLKSTIPGF